MRRYEYNLYEGGRSFGDHVLFAFAKLADLILSPVGHYRIGSVVKLLSIVFRRPKTSVVATLDTGGRFIFPVYDISWGSVVYGARPYEAEVEWLFRQLTPINFVFLDGGANFGFWSAWISGHLPAGQAKIYAVEPSPTCLPFLNKTAEESRGKIKVIPKAIHSMDGATLSFAVDDNHVASKVVSKVEVGERRITVRTTTIDAIIRDHELMDELILIKLDVEGQEVNAMQGGSVTAELDALFLYEDHGLDDQCAPTEYMLANGFAVFSFDGNRIVHINSVECVREKKVDKRKGYNFLSTKSTKWTNILNGIE